MSDYDSMASSASKGAVEAELQEFIMIEKQKQMIQQQIHQLNDTCWEKCVDKPGSKFDSKTETCLVNCVDRFIDTSVYITQRFAQILQKQTSGM